LTCCGAAAKPPPEMWQRRWTSVPKVFLWSLLAFSHPLSVAAEAPAKPLKLKERWALAQSNRQEKTAFLAAGDQEFLTGSNLELGLPPLSEARPMDLTSVFHKDQIKLLVEVGEILDQLKQQAEERIRTLGSQFAEQQAKLIESTLRSLENDPAAQSDFLLKTDGAKRLEILRKLEQLKNENFDQFSYLVGQAHLKLLIVDSELHGKVHTSHLSDVFTDKGRGKWNVLKNADGSLSLLAKVTHRSGLSFLVGDFDPSSDSALTYLAKQHFYAKAPTTQNPYGDPRVQGLDTVVITPKQVADSRDVRISTEEMEYSLTVHRRPSFLSREWFRTYIRATHVPATLDGVLFGTVCGLAQGVATACVGAASSYFLGHGKSWWEPMVFSMLFGATISTWYPTFRNFMDRGGFAVQVIKSLLLSFSYSYGVDILRHGGVENLITVVDPSGAFTLPYFTADQIMVHTGFLINKLIATAAGLRWDQWTEMRNKYGIDAKPVRIEIKIPGTSKVIVSYESQTVTQSSAHQQLVVNMIPFTTKVLGLVLSTDFKVMGVPFPLAQLTALLIAPFSKLAILNTLRHLETLPEWKDSEMLKADIRQTEKAWRIRRRLIFGWFWDPLVKPVLDPLLRSVGLMRKSSPIVEIEPFELASQASMSAEIDEIMSHDHSERLMKVHNHCETYLQ